MDFADGVTFNVSLPRAVFVNRAMGRMPALKSLSDGCEINLPHT